MQISIHTGLKVTPVEIHRGRIRRTELTNIVIDQSSNLSDWTKLIKWVTPKTDPHLRGLKRKMGCNEPHRDDEEKKDLHIVWPKSDERINRYSGIVISWNICILFWKKTQKKYMERKKRVIEFSHRWYQAHGSFRGQKNTASEIDINTG